MPDSLFNSKVTQLLHVQTGTVFKLPEHQEVIYIGKPNEVIPPDIDISDLPNAAVVSRIHAKIYTEEKAYYIEDAGSSNSTYINNSLLSPGEQYYLQVGDRISLGKGDLISFIFIKQKQTEQVIYDQQTELKLKERKKTIEVIFNSIHSGPLQALASIIRYARGEEIDFKILLEMLENLNLEIRKINEFLALDMIEDENSFYLKGTKKIDLSIPFDELLYEVYSQTLERDLMYFKNLKVKLPSFDCIEDHNISISIKKQVCSFLEEALCNVGKHAIGASRLEVIGELKDDYYILSIIDNGTEILASNKGEGTKQFQKIESKLKGKFRRINLEPHGILCELTWPVATNISQ